MSNLYIAVYGIYTNLLSVEKAVSKLKSSGFRNSDISVLLPSLNASGDLEQGNRRTKAIDGASAGADSDAVLVGIFGWLVGSGAIAIPGAGSFIAVGPIMSLLAGAGVGGLTEVLIRLGMPEYEAKRYEGLVRNGLILLFVHVDNRLWSNKAKEILVATGAEYISFKEQQLSDVNRKRKATVMNY